MKTTDSSISWSAILAGAIAGVGLNFLLNFLALGIGFSCFTIKLDGQTSFSLTGFLFFFVSAIIAMFFTGWIAGRLTTSILAKKWGILFGFLAWSMLLIITIILITNMIQYTSFHANFTSSLVAIKIIPHSPMLTETVAQQVKSSPLSVNIELKKKLIIVNALLTFGLFFVGAISSCIGGFIGYRDKLKIELLE